MRDLKIGTRLAMAFSIVILTLLSFAAFTCLKITNIDQATDGTNKATPSAAYLSEDLRSNIQRQSTLFQTMLITADKSELERLNAAFGAERSHNTDLLAKLNGLSSTEKLQNSLRDLMSARDAYTSALEPALGQIQTGADEAKQRAFDLDSQTIRAAYDRYLAAANDLVAEGRNGFEPQRPTGYITSEISTQILIFLAAALLVAAVVAWVAIRSVTTPVARSLELLDKVANGDLTARGVVFIEDEMGQWMTLFNRTLDRFWAAAGMAERLADGDDAVAVAIVSDRDILGRSLARLRNHLQLAAGMAQRLAEGDLNVEPDSTGDNNELLAALSRVREFIRQSAETTAKLADTNPNHASQDSEQIKTHIAFVERISNGDLSAPPTVQGEQDALGTALASMRENLRRKLQGVISAASDIACKSAEVASTSEKLCDRSSRQMAEAAAGTRCLNDLAFGLQEAVDQPRLTDRLAAAIAADGQATGDAMSGAVALMQEVNQRISALDDLSRKTDLLTLAGAVEAARAGDHGLGFAFVASELRKVGERSQAATAEVIRLTQDGVRSAMNAGESLQRLAPTVGETAEFVRTMAAACVGRQEEVAQAAQSVETIHRLFLENMKVSQELASTAEQLAGDAHALQSSMSLFKLSPNSPPFIHTPVALQKAAGG